MKKIEKISLANIKNLSRVEMRNIMAGSGSGSCSAKNCRFHSDCGTGCYCANVPGSDGACKYGSL